MEAKKWIGRSETVADVVTPTPYAALSATLNLPAERPPAGTPLPALWHWLYFLPIQPQSEIGPDGHAKRGGFLPPVPLPRRMWAESQFTFHAPVRVGDTITRKSTIDDVTEKTGRSGRLVFVRVRHDICREGDAAPAITELHEIVYREAPQPTDVVSPPQTAPEGAVWERRWVPDNVLLFRYSALTFNGHRIHYDRRYVTETEGYPGLIVHGPLIATLLVELLRHERPDAELASYRFRALRPTFATNHFFVCGRPACDARSVHLWARDHEGWLIMDAIAQLK